MRTGGTAGVLALGVVSLAGCFSAGGAPGDGGDPRDGGPDDGAAQVDAFVPDAAPASSCMPDETPGEGIFVSATHGDDEGGDGSSLRPYLTLGIAISAASALAQSTIYVEEGTYPESITIVPTLAGLTLRGGWVSAGAAWSRTCPAGVVSRTVIAPTTDPVAVHVQAGVAASGLELLTIATKQGASPPDASGETVIGLLVEGDGTTFSLTDVAVIAGDGGDGGTATMGARGATAPTFPACLLGTTCSTGGRGDDGLPRAPAAAGTFGPASYVPGDGAVGQAGTAGINGTPPTVGPESASTCQESCTCDGACHDPSGPETLRGDPGKCGCGGGGGQGGGAGRGGGATIAIVVDGASTVGVTRGQLLGGDGGDGSPGAAGGPGGAGQDGVVGNPKTCHEGCATGGGPCSSCYSAYERVLMGGGAGGTGGTGGTGGPGSAGAGGHSYVLVERGEGHVVLAGTVVVPGNPGVGAGVGDGKAPDGEAGKTLTQP